MSITFIGKKYGRTECIIHIGCMCSSSRLTASSACGSLRQLYPYVFLTFLHGDERRTTIKKTQSSTLCPYTDNIGI